MPNVDLSRVPEYYYRYIRLAMHQDLPQAFAEHQAEAAAILQPLTEEQWQYRYAEGKWSVKEMVQHLIDGERIFCYRALCFARKDNTPLPGFDENEYADASEADRRSGAGLIEELMTVQKSSAQLFASFSEEALEQSGLANNKSVYVRAIGYILVGHTRHHLNVLKERYGIGTKTWVPQEA